MNFRVCGAYKSIGTVGVRVRGVRHPRCGWVRIGSGATFGSVGPEPFLVLAVGVLSRRARIDMPPREDSENFG